MCVFWVFLSGTGPLSEPELQKESKPKIIVKNEHVMSEAYDCHDGMHHWTLGLIRLIWGGGSVRDTICIYLLFGCRHGVGIDSSIIQTKGFRFASEEQKGSFRPTAAPKPRRTKERCLGERETAPEPYLAAFLFLF